MRPSNLLCLVAINIGLTLSYPFYHNNGTSKTAYFQDDDQAGSNIIALRISDTDGTLSNPVSTATGGKGFKGFAVSQDSVVVSGNYLFTVNPGDDTLSLFVVDPANPEHPSLVGKPAPTLGETPVTVAYSPRLKTACVLNTGAVAGVTCFSVDQHKGLTALGGLRQIPQTENEDPLPALPPPLVIGADIVFNPSSTAVFVTIRSNGANPGLLYAYPVTNNQVSTDHVLSSLPTLPSLFSLNFLDHSDSHLLITSPHFNLPGAAFLQVSYPSLQTTLAKNITIPGQQNASCWVAYAPQYDSAYIFDALKSDITVIDPETGDIKGQVHFTAPAAAPGVSSGAQDSQVKGDYVYVLGDSATPKVYVFKIGGPQLLEEVQVFDNFAGLKPIPNWHGMAIWPASYY